jgi:polar amino acid transport system ATP-binding protein
MEEKGIYESGAPEKIFENPEKVKTIAFIRKLKTFNYKVDSYNFDLIGMCTLLELFCGKYAIESEKINNANLALEEMITYILQHCYEKPRQPDIHVVVEYSAIDKKIAVEIAHDGKDINPFSTISLDVDGCAGGTEDLGIFMVKKMSSEIDFRHEDGLSRFKIKI